MTSREPRSSGRPGVSCAHFRGGDCEAVQGRCSDGCPWEEAAWERLAAYEDTGLKPEDIDALQKREQGLAEMLVNVSCGCAVPYTRLAELAQAEKDGRLVRQTSPSNSSMVRPYLSSKVNRVCIRPK